MTWMKWSDCIQMNWDLKVHISGENWMVSPERQFATCQTQCLTTNARKQLYKETFIFRLFPTAISRRNLRLAQVVAIINILVISTIYSPWQCRTVSMNSMLGGASVTLYLNHVVAVRLQEKSWEQIIWSESGNNDMSRQTELPVLADMRRACQVDYLYSTCL